MKIIAINGSHRTGQSTEYLINLALDEAEKLGAQTEIIQLANAHIEFCIGCNKCLFKPTCTIQDDDMNQINEKLIDAEGIIVASPDYFSNVSARMKNFIDRTRPLHMTHNFLKGKVAGCITTAGLNNCGAEATNQILENFCATHEMLVVHPRPEGPVLASGITGSLLESVTDGIPRWRRSVKDDPIAPLLAKQLGVDMFHLIEKISS